MQKHPFYTSFAKKKKCQCKQINKYLQFGSKRYNTKEMLTNDQKNRQISYSRQ